MDGQLDQTAGFLASTIRKCEQMKLKFAEGTSQHTLLVNRIKALQISKALLEDACSAAQFSLSDLEQALSPILSIIHKTEKAQGKYEKDSVPYRRFIPILQAMYISKGLIEAGLAERC